MERICRSSGSEWEDKVGYSRVVRVEPFVEVAGTTAVDGAGEIQGKGNAYEQAAFIFRKIAGQLSAVGCPISAVTRTRIFVTNINDWEAIGDAHKEFFGLTAPVATMVEVQRLIHPDLVVEIEVSAIVTKE
jgi:enamine deaminase RidA (YjgF/YER057c/UK114 family)